MPPYKYDIAISCSGDDAEFAGQLSEQLKQQGLTVFFYKDPSTKAELLGQDLVQVLQPIFRDDTRHCVMIISSSYATNWGTQFEGHVILERHRNDRDYLIPIRLDTSEIRELPQTVVYIDATTAQARSNASLGAIANLIVLRAKPASGLVRSSRIEAVESAKIPFALHSYKEVIPLLVFCATLNVIAGGTVFRYTHGLLFFDTIGTCVMALAFGPWYGALSGAISNLVSAIVFTNADEYSSFAIVNAGLGLYWGLVTCWLPWICKVGPVASFRERFPFILLYGGGSILVSTVLATMIVAWHVGLPPVDSAPSIRSEAQTTQRINGAGNAAGASAVAAKSISNNIALYQATANFFANSVGFKLPEGASFGVSYILYNTPDKLTCTLLALLAMSYLLPLYKDNVQLFAAVRTVATERAGPAWMLVTAVASLAILIVFGHPSLIQMNLWGLLAVMCLISLLPSSIFFGHGVDGDKTPTALKGFLQTKEELERKLSMFRDKWAVRAGVSRALWVGAGTVMFYLAWFFIAWRLNMNGLEGLNEGILNALKVTALVCVGSASAMWLIADTIGYLIGDMGETRKDGSRPSS